MDTNDDGFKPPYMSFQTFWNFITELGTKPLPPRIDRSLMASKSGTDQFNLNLALTSFGLIDSNSGVLPLLTELVEADEERRKSLLATMVTRNYVEPMRVSGKHGTSKDLDDAFRTSYPSIASADTRRKAITFFLHAASFAGIELSANFPKTRSGSGAPGTSKPRKAVRRKPAPAAEERVNPAIGGPSAPATWDTHTVELVSGGTVFVAVNVDIFGLNASDRDFVLGLVDSMKSYQTPGTESKAHEEDLE